ncbi:MAG TPA: hypothetical protein VK742_11745 [Candidatus Sulfotelmatobacter sp.]|jgi:hypothetical protein|nr:hypothetical protein [Candidatus Sulfotelmatobacter sp.]
MRQCLFDSFADMIEAIPARAVLRTLERESKMVQEDLMMQRPVPAAQAASILDFCRFVEAVTLGLAIPAPSAASTAAQLEFYRKTVARLIAAGELPQNAAPEFDESFAGDHLHAAHYAM